MLKNRNIPYGYQREMGKITINPEESEVIKQIYLDYASGSSYKKIAEMLTAKKIRYLENRDTWNKNIIARILQNEKYLGTEEYPQIICDELKSKSESAVKTYTHTESKEIKIIKPYLICDICGAKAKRRLKSNGVERWYCEEDVKHIDVILNDISLQEDSILKITQTLKDFKFTEKISNKTSMEVVELQNKIDRELESEEINVAEIHNNIKKLAELKYSLLENTIHLKEHSLEKLRQDPLANLSEIKNIIKEITVSGKSIKHIVLIDDTVL